MPIKDFREKLPTTTVDRQAQLKKASCTRLALVSCGLGRVHRGFEVSTARWFQAVSSEPDLDVRLYAGGRYPQAREIFNIPRDFLLNSPLKVFANIDREKYWQFCYGVEQVSFLSVLNPFLLHYRPHVVWTKDVPFAHLLSAFRAAFNQKYKIIFANGGAFKVSTYKDFDYIQHLHPDSLDEARAQGVPDSKMQLLPNCVIVDQPQISKSEIRKQFGYKDDHYIVLCVAAWNSYQKRLDYLIDEVANIQSNNVRLLLCGHPESETAGLKQLAEKRLGDRVNWLTLSPEDVHKVMVMSDVFVLPSFKEGLANALIEAAMLGVPIVSHATPGARFALEDPYWLSDLTDNGALTNKLQQLKNNGVDTAKLAQLKIRTANRFGPKALAPQFADMIKTVRYINGDHV